MTLNLDIQRAAAFDRMSGDSTDLDPPLAGKLVRRSEFLAAMQRAVPWADLVASIERDAPQARKEMTPLTLESLLRIDFMQQWFGLSDPSMAGLLAAAPLYGDFALLPAGPDRRLAEMALPAFRKLLDRPALAPAVRAAFSASLRVRSEML